MAITNTEQLKAAFGVRAIQSNLEVQCPSDGTFNSHIAIVGEAPTDIEVSKKLPMVGAPGSLLWNTLRRFGITRMDCYITHVSKRHVSFKKQTNIPPMNRNEAELWRELLLWELEQLPNLRYVIALGNLALEALSSNQGVQQWRGSVLPVKLKNGRLIQVICSLNPSMVIIEPKNEIIFNLDMAKVKRVIDGKHKVPTIKTHINPSYSDALEFIEVLRKEAVQHQTPISLDVEVISMETACVGLAQSSSEAMCINWRTLKEQRYSVEQEREIRKAVQRLVGNPETRIIAQNGMFDLTWMWYKDAIRIHHIWFDTMLAHHALYPTLPHNLGFLTTQYTDHPYYKDEKDDWKEGGNIDQFWEYNGKDCCITWAAQVRIEQELKKAGLDKFFFDHVMRLQPVLARMTVAGIKMDMQLKEKIKNELSEDLSTKLTAFHNAVHQATGDDELYPNPKSPPQLARLFFNQLRLVGRGTSTDDNNRKRMLAHPRTTEPAKKVIYTLNDYLKDHKFFSTYVEMAVDPDGRARTVYKQTGVQSAPGRLSSEKTLWGSGMNFQNQPQRAYPMFIADEGDSLGYFDMAQAEARLVAYYADISLWKEQFERARRDGSYDAHRALASEMFGIPYDEVPKEDRLDSGEVTLRFIAKRCRHGLNYRMQADRLAETTGLILPEAIRAFNLYHRATPELRRWWSSLEKEVRDTKALYNAYGRRLIILERITEAALESIVAYKPQSTLGDHVTRVMYRSEEDPKWPSHARMWLNIHDALICVAPHDQIKTALSIMKKYAEEPIIIKGEECFIPADTKISVADDQGIHRWSTLKKVIL